ncbi:response regulator [Massilia sp. TS11]|uniref:response regulator n=1 Tax=Massilia sp. TS11 TaxID=2908003 RepID=UPI001EDB9C78|nr:response regulator [Massilia sp. TS11]MCG2584119.1 response regulator [Massilia sp. TS11]
MNRLHILVVDDSLDTRELVCEMLRALGHAATPASDAAAALTALGAAPHQVMITDVSLAGESGLELARAALSQHEGLRVIFATGHGISLLRHSPLAHACLQKPFDLDQLSQALTRVAPQARSAG